MNKYDSTADEVVCVIATDKNTGYITTCTSCDKSDSNHYAKYYRSIGYNSKVVTYAELDILLEKEKQERIWGGNIS